MSFWRTYQLLSQGLPSSMVLSHLFYVFLGVFKRILLTFHVCGLGSRNFCRFLGNGLGAWRHFSWNILRIHLKIIIKYITKIWSTHFCLRNEIFVNFVQNCVLSIKCHEMRKLNVFFMSDDQDWPKLA